jgi:hypothetical protein
MTVMNIHVESEFVKLSLKGLLARMIPIAIMLMFLCLRTHVQWFEHPSGPHTHYFAIKQKAAKADSLCTTALDTKPFPAQVMYPQEPFSELSIPVYPKAHYAETGILHCPGCSGERAPPAC